MVTTASSRAVTPSPLPVSVNVTANNVSSSGGATGSRRMTGTPALRADCNVASQSSAFFSLTAMPSIMMTVALRVTMDRTPRCAAASGSSTILVDT